MKIKNRSDIILFESKHDNIKEALIDAISSGADLSGADLSLADLSRADLSGADLSGADLYLADLSRADLSGADLSGANLSGANLSGADLSLADLYLADLSRADLSGADLSGANLSRANLSGADLENISISFQLVPEIGSFIGWKKAKGMILMLKIPKSAERTSNLKNRKCRCSYVKTLQIQNIDGSVSEIKSVPGDHDNHAIYEMGKTTKADFFDSDIRKDCTNGIHFFITRKEAVDY